MAGHENIIKANRERTSEEARENGRKGGIASGKARREKREFKEILETIMDMNIKSGRGADVENIKSIADVSGKNIKVKDAIALAMVQKAAKGDIRAAEWVRDMLGEKPSDKQREAEFDHKKKMDEKDDW